MEDLLYKKKINKKRMHQFPLVASQLCCACTHYVRSNDTKIHLKRIRKQKFLVTSAFQVS